MIKNPSDLSIEWVNRRYEELTGMCLKDIRGKKVGELWADPESAALIEKHDRDALNKDFTILVEEVSVRDRGKQHRLRIRFPIKGPDGRVRYLGAVGLGIERLLRSVDQEKLVSFVGELAGEL